jgi:hypothetical protein
VSFVNSAGTAATYLVVIDATTGSALAAGGYELTFSTAAVPPGDSCAAPAALAPNMTTPDTFATAGPDHAFTTAAGCKSSSSGKDRAYTITLGANQRLQVTFTPDGTSGIDGVLNLVDGTTPPVVCGVGATCIASADATFSNGVETLIYDNVGATAQTLYLVASAYGSTTSTGTFGLATTVGAIPGAPPGDTCTGPIVQTGSGSASFDLATFAANHTAMGGGTNCAFYSGNDIVYQVALTAGQTLAVSVTPAPAADVVINIVPSPAANCSSSATTCLANADNLATTTTPETTSFLSATAQTVFVVASRYGTGSFAGSIQFTITP